MIVHDFSNKKHSLKGEGESRKEVDCGVPTLLACIHHN